MRRIAVMCVAVPAALLTNPLRTQTISFWRLCDSKHTQDSSGGIMSSSGELIRMMNYVDDISTTLRRIVVGSGFISPEERKKLAEYMRNSDPNFTKMVEELDK
jgi:hypothetical protein